MSIVKLILRLPFSIVLSLAIFPIIIMFIIMDWLFESEDPILKKEIIDFYRGIWFIKKRR